MGALLRSAYNDDGDEMEDDGEDEPKERVVIEVVSRKVGTVLSPTCCCPSYCCTPQHGACEVGAHKYEKTQWELPAFAPTPSFLSLSCPCRPESRAKAWGTAQRVVNHSESDLCAMFRGSKHKVGKTVPSMLKSNNGNPSRYLE